jgi:hypothetical protein
MLAAAIAAVWAAPVGAATATWMGGPGCGGRTEWRQHPAVFPYFCDGAAEVEQAHWSNWGKPTATAHATMNEADLRHGTSVGTAPRIRSAITITASRIENCSGRRAYTSIKIRFDKPANGISTLTLPEVLPFCHPLSASAHYRYFVSPDHVVWCSAGASGAGAGAFCDVGNFWNNGFHSGEVHPSGVVRVCNHSPSEAYCGALGGGNVPVLHYGESTELGGVRCTSATNGITCTIVSGRDAGKGVRVSKTEAVAVG